MFLSAESLEKLQIPLANRFQYAQNGGLAVAVGAGQNRHAVGHGKPVGQSAQPVEGDFIVEVSEEAFDSQCQVVHGVPPP